MRLEVLSPQIDVPGLSTIQLAPKPSPSRRDARSARGPSFPLGHLNPRVGPPRPPDRQISPHPGRQPQEATLRRPEELICANLEEMLCASHEEIQRDMGREGVCVTEDVDNVFSASLCRRPLAQWLGGKRSRLKMETNVLFEKKQMPVLAIRGSA